MENKVPLWTLLFGIAAIVVGIYQFRKEWKKNGKKIFPIGENSLIPLHSLRVLILIIVLGLAFCINYISKV